MKKGKASFVWYTCSRLCCVSDEDCIIDDGRVKRCAMSGRFVKIIPGIVRSGKLKSKGWTCPECDGRVREVTLINNRHATQCESCGTVV
jgi:hypothetical protein